MLGRVKYQMKKVASKKHGYVVIVGIISLFLVIGGFSFAIFTSSAEKKGSLNIVTGDLVPTIESSSLDSNHSLMIKSGESRELIITLKNENDRDAKFNFWYEAMSGVYVYGANYNSEDDIPPDEDGVVIEKDGSRAYKLTITNTTSSEQEISFGSNGGMHNKKLEFPNDKKKVEVLEPVIDDNMIKVVYNEKEGSWEKASNKNWYNYDNGKWANVVTVTSVTRSKYQSASSGTAIPMNDIETMWVWIPRYSYTIGSEDGTNYYGKQGQYLNSTPTKALPGEIDIKFIPTYVKDKGSAQYKVSERVNNWRTPDGFTFGKEELVGVWVGKFETSSSNPIAEYGGGNVTNLDAMIKPNVTSWRGMQASNMAEVGRSLTKSGNRYGFSTTLFNSHAMKTSEWALASYLSQSKYGKLGNRAYSGANKEIYQNKSSNYITGCSYGAPSNGNRDYGCQYTYEKSPAGTGASTTGTIYGIYDMSGGAWEYTMGNYAPGGQKHSGMNTTYHSGYTGLLQNGSSVTGKSWLEDKYYDFYTSSDPLTACNGKPCISQALNETAGWYGDHIYLVTAQYPWFVRGGFSCDATIAGIFHFGNLPGSNGGADGHALGGGTFRFVLNVA